MLKPRMRDQVGLIALATLSKKIYKIYKLSNEVKSYSTQVWYISGGCNMIK